MANAKILILAGAAAESLEAKNRYPRLQGYVVNYSAHKKEIASCGSRF